MSNQKEKKGFKKVFIHLQALIKTLIEKSKNATLPGFQGQSIYNVGKIFISGFTKGHLTDRAAAVAFNFFTALFPLLLFVFTLIPYVPFPNFQTELIVALQEFIPGNIWDLISPTITHIITQKQGGVLSLGAIFALYFGSNGINSLLFAFTQTKDDIGKHGWFRLRLNSLIVLCIVALLIMLSIGMASGGRILIYYIHQVHLQTSALMIFLIHFTKWLMTVFFLLSAISFLYHLAVKEKKPFPFLSIGAILTTGLMIATTWGFEIYIENFTHYNALYGSLGTILILTMYLYLNSMFLLIGFEINASIYSAKKLSRQTNELQNN